MTRRIHFLSLSLLVILTFSHFAEGSRKHVTVKVDHEADSDSQEDDGHKNKDQKETTRSTSKCAGPEYECNIRLNPNVFPVHYDLHLFPEIEAGVFSGRVCILLNLTEPTDHIRLHINSLNVTSTQLSKADDPSKHLELEKTVGVPANDYWVAIPKEKLSNGHYIITLEFNGSLTKSITGFYRSKYVDPISNQTKYMLATTFQPTFAREAFPSFDEPSFKSTFSVSIVKPSNLQALGNMPVKSEEVNVPRPQLTVVHFEKSVPMVTYLVAFVVGDLGCSSGKSKSNVTVKVCSVAHKVNGTVYGASIAPAILDRFEEFFNIKYPLPKLDIVAPPDMMIAAMENWGLVTFQERNLLWKKGVASAQNKQRIASVIAHEIGHMWFGNLVTGKWWDALWLNEGFATYIQYKGVDAVHPDWEMLRQQTNTDLTPALKSDGLQHSHPIVQAVDHPDQISEMFDDISYKKGGSSIRMMENLLSPEKFRKAITKYLNKFAYSNAVTEDLWAALQTEAPEGVNISLVMDTWTKQMGYPVVSVSCKKSGAVVSQEQFKNTPSSKYSESPFGYKWEIPLQITPSSSSDGKSPFFWLHLDGAPATLPKELIADSDYVKVNTGQFGYFRVKYDSETLEKIEKDYLTKFSPEERCGLLDDVFSLAYSNYTGYDTALRFGLQLTNEKHYIPWRCVSPHLSKILELLVHASGLTYDLFRNYVKEITNPQFERLSWSDAEDDPHLERLLKPLIFALNCQSGRSACRERVTKLFSDWVNNKTPIPPSLRQLVYKQGLSSSNNTIWTNVKSRFEKESSSIEQLNLLRALASSHEPWILSKLLELGEDESIIKKHIHPDFLAFVASNPVGTPIVWTYYRNNYEKLVERFGKGNRYFGGVIKSLTGSFCLDTQLQEMDLLYKMYPDAGAGATSRKVAYETVQSQVQWAKRSVPVIKAWLQNHFKNAK